jgi:hypothetical protein
MTVRRNSIRIIVNSDQRIQRLPSCIRTVSFLSFRSAAATELRPYITAGIEFLSSSCTSICRYSLQGWLLYGKLWTIWKHRYYYLFHSRDRHERTILICTTEVFMWNRRLTGAISTCSPYDVPNYIVFTELQDCNKLSVVCITGIQHSCQTNMYRSCEQ